MRGGGISLGRRAVSPDGGGPLHALPGVMAPDFPGLVASDMTLAANRLYVARFVPPRNMLIQAIRHVLSTVAGSDDPIDVGILDAAGNRLVSSGSVAGKLIGATGAKSTGIAPTALSRDTPYFAVLACGAIGTTAAHLTGLAPTSFGLAGAFFAVLGAVDNRQLTGIKDAVFPIPANLNLATTTMTGGGCPALALME